MDHWRRGLGKEKTKKKSHAGDQRDRDAETQTDGQPWTDGRTDGEYIRGRVAVAVTADGHLGAQEAADDNL